MTKKYDLFMVALQHLCEVHEVSFCAGYSEIEVWDGYDEFMDESFEDRTKEPS